jgi:hypothetical protein
VIPARVVVAAATMPGVATVVITVVTVVVIITVAVIIIVATATVVVVAATVVIITVTAMVIVVVTTARVIIIAPAATVLGIEAIAVVVRHAVTDPNPDLAILQLGVEVDAPAVVGEVNLDLASLWHLDVGQPAFGRHDPAERQSPAVVGDRHAASVADLVGDVVDCSTIRGGRRLYISGGRRRGCRRFGAAGSVGDADARRGKHQRSSSR